jgi:DinB superfamily
MNPLYQIIKQYQLLTDWYVSVLDGISEQDGRKTIDGHTNSLEWLAGHLITGRTRNIGRLGIQVEPYKYLDQFINPSIPPPNALAFDPKTNYASLTECIDLWNSYADIFMGGLTKVDENTLKNEIPFSVPIGGNTVEDALAFVVIHESYHIGQMSIIRNSLGYKPMQLSLRKK